MGPQVSLSAKRTEATNAGNGGGQGAPYQVPPEEAPAEEEEVSETPMPQEKGMDWVLNGRGQLLLNQIVATGMKAFLTSRANLKGVQGKPDLKYDRKKAWLNEEDGIIPMLKKAEEFKGAVWPNNEEGVIRWVQRTVKNHKHLYTEGMEQAEPAGAGSEGTKDEKPLTPFQQAIIEVAELMTEADRITKEHQAGRRAAEEETAAHAREMQDEAVKKAYSNGTPKDTQDGNKKRRRPDSPDKSAITVAAYAEEHLKDPRKLLEECEAGRPPAGYTFVDPEGKDQVDGEGFLFGEPYLVPVKVAPGGPGGLRKAIEEGMQERNKLKERSLELEETKEANRAEERKKELEIRATEAKAKADAEAAAAANSNMMMQMLMQLQKQMNGGGNSQ